MTDEHIVYLFGAGASANAIPTVDSFRGWIKATTQSLSRSYRHHRKRSPKIANSIQAILGKMERFDQLLKDSPSPDTLAMHARITGDDGKLGWDAAEISRLTEVLFVLKEIGLPREEDLSDFGIKVKDRSYDLRYLNWLLGLARTESRRVVFPPEISVLTWNYDTGLLRALNHIHRSLRSTADHIDPPTDEKEYEGTMRVLYLNGISISTFDALDPDSSAEDLMDSLAAILSGKRDSAISFAWTASRAERSTEFSIMAKATVVVAIGYSFPNYNAPVDIELLKAATRLRRVYVQTHDRTATADVADILRTRLEAAGKTPYTEWNRTLNGALKGNCVQVREITNPHQFIIPPEAARLLCGGG